MWHELRSADEAGKELYLSPLYSTAVSLLVSPFGGYQTSVRFFDFSVCELMYSDGGLWSVLPCSLGFVVYEFEISGVYFILFFLFSERESRASVVNAPAAARCSGPPRIEQVHP